MKFMIYIWKTLKNKIEIKKVATIDIGSNAIRLLISNIFKIKGSIYYTKNSLHRVPVRLGQDSFTNGQIDISNKNNTSPPKTDNSETNVKDNSEANADKKSLKTKDDINSNAKNNLLDNDNKGKESNETKN